MKTVFDFPQGAKGQGCVSCCLSLQPPDPSIGTGWRQICPGFGFCPPLLFSWLTMGRLSQSLLIIFKVVFPTVYIIGQKSETKSNLWTECVVHWWSIFLTRHKTGLVPWQHKLGIMADACNPHLQGFTLGIMSSYRWLYSNCQNSLGKKSRGTQSQNKKKQYKTL